MDNQPAHEATENGVQRKWNFPFPEFLAKLQSQVDAPEHLISDIYAKWVDTFEQDSMQFGYAAHILCTQAFDANASKVFKDKAKSTLRVIDVGAGTGIVGGLLKDLGYTDVDGIDCCEAMLQKARDKNIYKNVFVSFVDEKKNEALDDGIYDALISSAAISPPLIQARAFDEMIRWVKKGGILCFTIRQDSLDQPSYGYFEKFQKLEDEKKWHLIAKELVDYYKSEGSDDIFGSKAYICVYQVL